MIEHSKPSLGRDRVVLRLAIAAFAATGLLAQRRASVDHPASSAATPRGGPDTGGAGKKSATVRKPGLLGVGQAVFERFGRDNTSLIAAGIAFYILAALFPALAAMVSIYGLVADPTPVADRVKGLDSMLPPEASKIIIDGIESFAHKSGSQLSFALVVSLVLALWSARAGMSSVMTGLNIAYEETEKRSFIMQNVIALALTLGGILFGILIILAVAIVPAALAFLHPDGVVAQVLDIARWPVLAVVVVLVFAVIYRYAPSRSHADWRWISWGSGIAAVLWMVGSVVFSFYVSHFGSYSATYGALGAVVIMLLWFWVSATVLLLGAEIDDEIDERARDAGSPLEAGVDR